MIEHRGYKVVQYPQTLSVIVFSKYGNIVKAVKHNRILRTKELKAIVDEYIKDKEMLFRNGGKND